MIMTPSNDQVGVLLGVLSIFENHESLCISTYSVFSGSGPRTKLTFQEIPERPEPLLNRGFYCPLFLCNSKHRLEFMPKSKWRHETYVAHL